MAAGPCGDSGEDGGEDVDAEERSCHPRME